MPVAVKKYNPGFLTDDELVASYCVRTQEFESVLEVLRECTGNANQHQLVIGPRGIGKTSLLLRVAAEVRRDAELSQGFHPVVFPEESYEVGSAGEFWLECLARLADQEPPSDNGPDLHSAYEELRQVRDDRLLGERCLGILQDFSDREGKRLVLVVENLNMLFADIMDRDAGWRLRQTLQNEPRIVLLASATNRFDEIDRRDRALYDQFRVLHLRRLGLDECAVLWQAVSGRQRAPQTIQALRILTGGSPRLITIIAQFAAKLSFRELMSDLLNLVDDHTEYFKSHVDALAPQERRVYLALADLWRPASTREIADRSRLDTSKCSAYLARLIDRGAVEMPTGTARRKLYYVAERLFNIYYLLRKSRGPAPMVEALIHFMEAYYSPAELKDFGIRMALEAKSFDDATQLVSQFAFARLLESPSLAKHRDELLSVAPDISGGQMTVPPAIDAAPTEAEAMSRQAFDLARAGQLREALSAWDAVVRHHGASQTLVDREQTAISLVNKGVTLGRLGQINEALAAWAEVDRRFGSDTNPELLEAVATAIVNRGAMYGDLNKHRDALAAFNEVLQRFGTDHPQTVPEQLATALTCKGVALLDLERPRDALAAWDEAVRRFGTSDIPAVLRQVGAALMNKGDFLAQVGRAEEALAAWDEITRRFSTIDTPALSGLVAAALTEKCLALNRWDRPTEAVEACDEVLLRFPTSDAPGLLRAVAGAFVNKGTALASLGRLDEAIGAWDEAVRRFGSGDGEMLVNAVAPAQANKAKALVELNRADEAIDTWEDMVRRFGTSEVPELLGAGAAALISKGLVLAQMARLDDAIATLDEAVQRFGTSDSPMLQAVVARALTSKGMALADSGRPEEAMGAWEEVVRRFGTSDVPNVLDAVLEALIKKGSALDALGRPAEAVHAWDEVARRAATIGSPGMVDAGARALVNKGAALAESNQPEEAAAVWDEVVTRFGEIDVPLVLQSVAGALLNKGNVLFELERLEEAIDTWDEVVARFATIPLLAEPDPVAISLTNKSAALAKLDRLDDAVAVCDEVVQHFGSHDTPTHRNSTEMALLRKAGIELERRRAEAALASVSQLLARSMPVSNAHRVQGHLMRARASLMLGDDAGYSADLNLVLTTLPTLDSPPKSVIDDLSALAIEVGLQELLDLIEESPAAASLLPFTTALKRELGMTPRVAREIEEVAEDIRRDLAAYRSEGTN